jgi:hypothetical protein
VKTLREGVARGIRELRGFTMATLRIEIDLDGDAFSDEDGNLVWELHRLLAKVAEGVACKVSRLRAAKAEPGIPGEPSKLLDVNGNTCGSFQLDS